MAPYTHSIDDRTVAGMQTLGILFFYVSLGSHDSTELLGTRKLHDMYLIKYAASKLARDLDLAYEFAL